MALLPIFYWVGVGLGLGSSTVSWYYSCFQPNIFLVNCKYPNVSVSLFNNNSNGSVTVRFRNNERVTMELFVALCQPKNIPGILIALHCRSSRWVSYRSTCASGWQSVWRTGAPSLPWPSWLLYQQPQKQSRIVGYLTANNQPVRHSSPTLMR